MIYFQDFGGSIIPLESLCEHESDQVRVGAGVLEPSTGNYSTLPLSSVLLSYLREAKAKGPDPQVSGLTVTLGDNTIKLESDVSSLSELETLRCEGYWSKSVLNLKLNMEQSWNVWGGGAEANSVFKYLFLQDRTAILRTGDHRSLLLVAESETSGVLQLLQKSDSNFVSCLLKLNRFHVEPAVLPVEYTEILDTSFPCPETDPGDVNSTRGFWDVSAVEKWRVPDVPSVRLQQIFQDKASRRRERMIQKSSLMQKVRESYVAKGWSRIFNLISLFYFLSLKRLGE